MTDIYSSAELPGYNHPHPETIKLGLICGVALTLLAALALLLNLGLVFKFVAAIQQLLSNPDQLKWGESVFSEADLISIFGVFIALLSTIIYLVLFLPAWVKSIHIGLTTTTKALFDKLDDPNGGHVPPDFKSPSDVVSQIIAKTTIINDSLDGFTKTIFGKNIKYLSPEAGAIAKPIALQAKNALGRLITRLIILVLSIAAAAYGLRLVRESEFVVDMMSTGQKTAELAFGNPALIGELVFPLILVALAMASTLFASTYFMRLVIPKGSPKTENQVVKDSFEASLSPFLLINRLPNYLNSLALDNFDNRLSTFEGERSSASLSDTGDFDMQVLAERQPLPIKTPYEKAGKFWLYVGWAEVLLGFAILAFLVMPSSVRHVLSEQGLLETKNFLSPVGVFLTSIISLHLFLRGNEKATQANQLLNANWFSSPIVFIRTRGTISKSKVTMGGANTDSFKSETNLVRSNFLAEIVSAEIVSEWSEKREFRSLIALQNSPESKKWLDASLEGIRTLAAERVKATGMDFTTDDAADFVNANAAVTEGKARAKIRAKHSEKLSQKESAKIEESKDASPNQKGLEEE